METADLKSYEPQLILCPHCGADGQFKEIPIQDLTEKVVLDQYRHLVFVQTVCSGCGHISRLVPSTKEGAIALIEEWTKGSPAVLVTKLDLPKDVPIIVNYGAGVDSTAMLVAMVQQGIKPDYIMFADIGNERPESYAFLTFFSDWLQEQGFPAITTVKYRPETAPYTTLEGNCLANETLPSISISGKGSCTLKFKGTVMDRALLGASRGPWKGEGQPDILTCVAAGKKPVKLIGYDFGAADTCRFKKAGKLTKDDPFDYFYPLQEQLKWTREDCIFAIIKAGLPVPIKSSCSFCCGLKRWELKWTAAVHPSLLIRALQMEDKAKHGKHGFVSTKGLGRSFSWRTWCEEQEIIVPGTYNIIADPDELLRQVREEMPELESNLNFRLPLQEIAA